MRVRALSWAVWIALLILSSVRSLDAFLGLVIGALVVVLILWAHQDDAIVHESGDPDRALRVASIGLAAFVVLLLAIAVLFGLPVSSKGLIS